MTFLEHAQAHGLIIRDLASDGRWHRVPTTDKPRKRNGAYLFDGSRGVVKNWATMDDFAAWPERGQRVESIDPLKLERMRKENLRKEQEKHERVARVAEHNLRSAALQTHPYLAKKGFPLEQGLVLNEDLLIPMRHYQSQKLMSLQRISPEGGKMFMTGGQTRGAVYIIGRKRYPAGRIFCEGYATGLSVRAALDYIRQPLEVWVCFSASNMVFVADKVGGKRAVVADNDASRTGQKAAESTGLPWVMPDPVGMDFNDLHRSEGLGACVRLLRGLLQREVA